MRKKIVFWIKERVKFCRAKGLVLGLSGGIDSCVTAALAREALGQSKVLALLLPCHSHKSDLKDAQAVARKFGINTKIVDLTKIYDALVKILPPADRITRANIRPRLRMIVLYYFARKLNYLVCGTSNKSEIMAGYFTKYGDGASDIIPLGDLYKTQVRKLARELKIPQAIIDKAPTAGLWQGQTDEAEMGISYPELDDILSCLEKGKSRALPKKNIEKVKWMIKATGHKRQGPAVCKF
jgi:NAD+ synthase